MSIILSGIIAREELKKTLVTEIKALQEKRSVPLTLAIIHVGNRADSAAYINAKKRFAAEIGILVKPVCLKEDVSQNKVVALIKKLNQDEGITGTIVQLPLPKGSEERIILDAIDPSKDTDALTLMNVRKWMEVGANEAVQDGILYPATARGVGELFDFYKIDLKGKKVCIIGRSRFVGTPIACLCRAKGALVTICHSGTEDLKKETLAANIIVSVVGKAGLITAEHVRSGQVVIDVGINEVSGAKLDKEISNHPASRRIVGDVDFENVLAVLGDSGAITPVPGGVGPMTVLGLFENLVDCARIQASGDDNHRCKSGALRNFSKS